MSTRNEREAATSAQLYQPGALALDAAGRMFVADTGTQRVRQVRTRNRGFTIMEVELREATESQLAVWYNQA